MKILVCTKKHTYNITDLITFLGASMFFLGLIAIGCYFESLM